MPKLLVPTIAIHLLCLAPVHAQEQVPDHDVEELRRLVEAHSTCVLGKAVVYYDSNESAGDIADAAMAECRDKFVLVESHIQKIMEPSPGTSADVAIFASQGAESLIERARRGARDAVVAGVIAARTGTPSGDEGRP